MTSDPTTPVENDQEENIKMVTNPKEEETISCPGCRKHEYREVDLDSNMIQEQKSRLLAKTMQSRLASTVN
jgi:hypothetical protein